MIVFELEFPDREPIWTSFRPPAINRGDIKEPKKEE